jgi:CheY-like chemotaxis protein
MRVSRPARSRVLPVGDGAGGVPETFAEHVRDALLHLYDYARLQTHPLLDTIGDEGASPLQGGSPIARGRLLRQRLLDAVDSLRPEGGLDADARACRAHRILELRYLEGVEAGDVMRQVALGKTQYHREHNRALEAVASVLWDQWCVPKRSSGPPAGVQREASEPDRAWLAAEHLLPGNAMLLVDPIDSAHQVAALLRALCRQREVELRLSVVGPATELPPVRGDGVVLRHALVAVLGHAIGATERTVLQVTLESESGSLLLRVRGETTPAAGHLRLGIDECRPFVEALGGTVTATLPERAHWEIRLRFPTRNVPVLLVADNSADFVRLVERYLVGSGWEVVGASTIDQAYAASQQRRPDAVLLDVVFPERDGWDLLLRLKSLDSTRDVPIVVCSALDEAAVAASLGAAGYLRKPISQAGLIDALSRCV